MANSNELVIRVVGDSTQFTRTITQVNTAINRAGANARQFGQHGVTSVQAISASLRLAEGNFTNLLRAGERFIALSPALSNIAKAIFPLVGGFAVGTIFARMGKEAYEFIKQVNEVPKALQAGFQALNLSQQQANDALSVTNDKLEIEIAKLEHKPVNGLKLTIDEARVAADDLAKSLQTDAERMDALLKQHQISALGAFFTGNAGTADVSGSVTYYEQKLSDLGYQYAQAIRQGNQSLANNLRSQINATRGSFRQYNQSQIASRRSGQGYIGNQAGNLAILEGADENLTDTEIREQETARNKQLDAQKQADELRNTQSREAAEAQRKQQEQIIKDWTSQLDSLKAVEDVTVEREVSFWTQRVAASQAGSQSYIQALNNANKAIAQIRGENVRASTEFDKTAAGPVDSERFDLTRDSSVTRPLQDYSRINAENIETAHQLREAIEQANDAFAEQAIQIAVAQGRMTQYQAAIASAALQDDQFDRQRVRLNQQLRDAQASGNPFQINAAQNAIDLLNVQQGTANQQSQAAIRANTPSGAFNDALNQFVTASQDAARAMRDIVTGTLNSLNNDIVNGRGFRQTGQDLFRSVAGYGLQRAEGSVLSAFGFGSKADGSSEANALWVRIAAAQAAIGAASIPAALQTSIESGGGSGVSTLLNAIPLSGFIPGFARGGTPLPDSDIVVGEEGPEVWHVPSGSRGSVIPNGALGGTTNHVYVDATGSQDPNGVEAAVHRAMSQYLPYSVGASVQAVQERQKRRPLSAR